MRVCARVPLCACLCTEGNSKQSKREVEAEARREPQGSGFFTAPEVEHLLSEGLGFQPGPAFLLRNDAACE